MLVGAFFSLLQWRQHRPSTAFTLASAGESWWHFCDVHCLAHPLCEKIGSRSAFVEALLDMQESHLPLHGDSGAWSMLGYLLCPT